MLSSIEIGNNLKSFAEKNNYSWAELGRLLNMKQQAFRKYYEGERIPGGKILAKLALLGCDINWLLTGKEQPTANMFNESRTEIKTATVNEPLEKYFEQNKIPGKVPDTTMIVLEHLYKELEQIKKTLSKLACQQNREE